MKDTLTNEYILEESLNSNDLITLCMATKLRERNLKKHIIIEANSFNGLSHLQILDLSCT